MTLNDERGEKLFRRFMHEGFEALASEEPQELADWLEDRAVASGEAANLFLALTIRAVYLLFRSHDEHGGTQLNFVRWLDHLVTQAIPEIEAAAPPEAARLAQNFNREISERLNGYSPSRDYSL